MTAQATSGGTQVTSTEIASSPKINAVASITLPGTGSETVSTLALLGAVITIPGAGGESVLMNLNATGNLTFAGTGGERVQPQVNMVTNANFAGASSETVQPQVSMVTNANFAGVGSETVQSQVQMPTSANFAGAGSESVAQPHVSMVTNASFAGAGGTSFLTNLGQSVVVNYIGTGSLSVSTTTGHVATAWSGSATFAGQGGVFVATSIISGAVTVAANDLALISTDNFIVIDPDDLMVSATRHLYLKSDTPRLPAPIYFQAPHGLIFSGNQAAVSIGQVDAITPKGTFPAGHYLLYSVAIDQFNQQGVWRAFWEFGGKGAPFYSTLGTQPLVHTQFLLAENGNFLITENGYNIDTES